ncbi:hypothetical protein [Gordonia sp. NPDC003376]
MSTYFHGTETAITDITWAICLTDDADIAAEYLQGNDGHLYTVALDDDARLADEDDLIAATDTLGLTRTQGIDAGDWTDLFEAADNAKVQAVLAGQGFAGVTYGDTTYGGVSHKTVLVWDTAAIEITDHSEVSDEDVA